VGSVLKPLLVATVPSFRSDGRWRDALARSDAKYFMARAEPSADDWAPYLQLFTALGGRAPQLETARAIGILPGLELSVAQVASAYAAIATTAPEVLDALRSTPRAGTLAGLPDSAWFTARKIALKTGTMRDTSSTPVHGWIAAVGDAFIVVTHANGWPATRLLPTVRALIEQQAPPSAETARVQILGSVPKVTVDLSCPPQHPMAIDAKLAAGATVAVSAMRPNAHYRCLGAPITTGFTDRKGRRVERAYAGALVLDPLPKATLPSRAMRPTDPRAAAARLGSDLVLETSMRHYVYDVLASEYPHGHVETLKALAVSVRNNAGVPRHGERPLCDTTHCQVFGHAGRLAAGLRKRLLAATDAALIAPEGARTGAARIWMPFQLGGYEPWSRELPSAEVQRRLGGATPLADVPCEILRNQLKLPSCPESITPSGDGSTLRFAGRGEGHGLGLSLVEADVWAARGLDFRALLAKFRR
jgi:hypothetical protein